MLRRLTLTLPDAAREALHVEILRRAQAEPSYTRTHAVNAWRSASDLIDWPVAAPFRDALVRLLSDAELRIKPPTLRAWAIVSRRGAAHRRHIHPPRYDWSGVYYLTPGGPDSARTVFETPNGPQYVVPESNLIVIFPSNMWHAVEPHQSDDTRVTVAFNVSSAQRAQ